MRFLPLIALLLAASPAQAQPLMPSGLWPDTSAAARSVLPLRKPAPGRIGRFARLAGMFMGRVDCASMGPMKFRLVLDLR